MNKTATEIVKQYIIETTETGSPGITDKAKECLLHLMREDREIAMSLWDRVEGLKRVGISYVYNPVNDDTESDQDNEWNS